MIPGMITDRMIRKGYIDREERELFIYGFDITLYTFFSTAGLLLAGFMVHRLVSSVILVFGFYALQTSGGGYHAETHTRCFLLMLAGLFLGLSYEFLEGSVTLLWILYAAGIVILSAFPLVLHPNKEYLSSERGKLMVKSYMALVFLILLSVILMKTLLISLPVFSALFSLSSLSRVIGKVKYRRMNREEDS